MSFQGGILIYGVILAAGSGERLHPLTKEIPKALLNVAGKTLLEWAVDRYNQAGINDLIIAVGWKGTMIDDFISTSNIEAKVIHVPNYETGPLQTLLTAIETFDGDFLLSPVDAMINPASMNGIRTHHSSIDDTGGMTLAVDSDADSGTLVKCGQDGLITAIGDELDVEGITRSAMLLIANTRIRNLCKSALADGKNRVVQLLGQLINDGEKLRCFHVSHPWFDIDTFSDILRANRHFLQRGGSQETESVYIPMGDSVDVGDSFTMKSNITLGKGTTLKGPVLISSNCQIGEECKVGPNVTIDSNTTLAKGCEITDTVIFGVSSLSVQSRVHRCIIYGSKRYSSEM